VNRLRSIISRTLAFTKKEFKLISRYKFNYLSQTIIMPILHVLPLLIIYGGIVAIAPSEWESINPQNVLPWVLVGSVIYSVYSLGYTVFRTRFSMEKYWMTIYGTLIAPISKYYLLFGVIIELTVKAFVTSVLFIIISLLVYPTSILNLFLLFGLIMMTLIAGAGISLVNGTMFLINENISSIFDYILFVLVFFSTYSIPYEFYPTGILQFIVNINPLYHFVNLGRQIWFMQLSFESLWSLLYISIFTILCVIIGVLVFSKSTRRFGVRGY